MPCRGSVVHREPCRKHTGTPSLWTGTKQLSGVRPLRGALLVCCGNDGDCRPYHVGAPWSTVNCAGNTRKRRHCGPVPSDYPGYGHCGAHCRFAVATTGTTGRTVPGSVVHREPRRIPTGLPSLRRLPWADGSVPNDYAGYSHLGCRAGLPWYRWGCRPYHAAVDSPGTEVTIGDACPKRSVPHRTHV